MTPNDTSSSPSEPKRADDLPVQLLVVEDDPDQQDLISEVLQDHFGPGCVQVAGTCEQGLHLATTAERPFDLILTDYNLPDGNGVDLLAKLRARTPSPIMLLTGENDHGTARAAVEGGAVDYVVKAGAYLVTMPLTVEKNLTAARVALQQNQRQESARREMETQLKEAELLANTDGMTGCYNRRAFEKIFDQLLAEAQRTGAELACIMLDLDKFKQVNDSFGHDVGDELVKAAAEAIKGNLRTMDVACRYGGDEFIILLPKATSDLAQRAAQRIRNAYAMTSNALVGEAKTMSVGTACLRETDPPPKSSQELWVAADKALIRAKELGRDQICSAA